MLKWITLLVLSCFGFLLSLWQNEIAFINIQNGWTFGFLFSLLRFQNNWAVNDFFYLLAGLCFLGAIIAAYKIGKEVNELELFRKVQK